jgi:predicted RNA-binding protein with RPS1 domain
MIAPGTLTLRDLEEGMVVPGKVTRLERYGAFVDIGVGRDGMLHVKEMGHGYVQKPEDVVQVGETLQVQVVGVDKRRGRIDLSIKELLPKPQEAPVPVVEQPRVEAAEDLVFPDDDREFTSPFELAFQEARSNARGDKRRRKKARAWEYEEDYEENLISRTIAHHRKSKGM